MGFKIFSSFNIIKKVSFMQHIIFWDLDFFSLYSILIKIHPYFVF